MRINRGRLKYLSKSVGVLDIFILFQKGHLLDFAKNVMPLLESKFLVMCEGIVEELKFQFVKTWY
jgi:hypothetical protein